MSNILRPNYSPRRRRRPIRHTFTAGAFAPGQFVHVSDTPPYLATVERNIGGMARVRSVETDRVETVAEHRLSELSRAELANAILAYFGASDNDDLRAFVARALEFHGDTARALPGGYSILIGDPATSRLTVELYRDEYVIVAAQRYTFKQLAWTVRS